LTSPGDLPINSSSADQDSAGACDQPREMHEKHEMRKMREKHEKREKREKHEKREKSEKREVR
jgi:hypothetical protein